MSPIFRIAGRFLLTGSAAVVILTGIMYIVMVISSLIFRRLTIL